ncbi:hypothetical protein M0R45_028143 [Rubus argutus]|uniref:Uncharacterized protein n=1 Tax=Rubus argutus TaxID=59490 RepID=A0AAW1W490_RUBAR
MAKLMDHGFGYGYLELVIFIAGAAWDRVVVVSLWLWVWIGDGDAWFRQSRDWARQVLLYQFHFFSGFGVVIAVGLVILMVAGFEHGLIGDHNGTREHRPRFVQRRESSLRGRGLSDPDSCGDNPELEFKDRYRKWYSCDISSFDLFQAPVHKFVPELCSASMVVDVKRNLSEGRALYFDNQDAINTAIDEVAECGHPFVFAHQVIANISSLFYKALRGSPRKSKA